MWVRVQDENTAIICKGWQIIKTTKSRDMWTQIETQIGKELETRRNENSNLKQSMSIICNNCNMQFIHLPSCATCNMQDMHQAKCLRYNCNVSINID